MKKQIKAKERISDTVNFLNKKVAEIQDQEENSFLKFVETPGGEYVTPGGFNDTFNSGSNNLMDEENIVIFHDKDKIEKFIAELPQM